MPTIASTSVKAAPDKRCFEYESLVLRFMQSAANQQLDCHSFRRNVTIGHAQSLLGREPSILGGWAGGIPIVFEWDNAAVAGPPKRHGAGPSKVGVAKAPHCVRN